MLGTFEKNPARPHAHKTKQNEQENATNKTQPQHLTHFEGDKKEATPEEIERVLGVIQVMYKDDPVPIDYFELVVNPMSFGHTIENMFHLAFLVKDGFVRIFLNENQIPVVEPVDQNSESHHHGEKKCNQVMVSLSMDEWRDIINIYQLEGREPFIKSSIPNNSETECMPSSSKKSKK